MAEKEKLEKIQEKLESITRRWWFLLIFILLGMITPPIVTGGFDSSKIGEIITYILRNSLLAKGYFTSSYPIFKILPIILIFALIFLGKLISRIFNLYAGITYILFAVIQSIAITDKHSFGIVTGNFITMLIVALFWFLEASVNKNDFSPRKISIIKYWVVPLAFLAFWYPIDLLQAFSE